ncbi:MAG TPA: histidine triad nucleotide-binding protein [Anaerolineales bacterium]|nr:histidine triad nucleotide-binding protein [Anaerolineales bacterium]HNF93673.1 histidine triad nucleotide-binding protein [Anaerolineales bacterium]HNH26307.1 histidine triad nucleotide-binding protein [Anaerolineales bacterium]HNO94025.1 histidine triad nucleotide-binding protein [Anaerolineales bacterium]
MSDCIFCKIIKGEIPSTNVYKDEFVTAFRDINPAAPTHILIVPNKHIDSVNMLIPDDEPLIGKMFSIAKQLANKEGIAESGYRLLVNTGEEAGQTVFHIHLHLLGGRTMRALG